MSFILDALRKSEHERQRSAVPGLSQVPLATPQSQLPRWAVVVIGALAVGVVALGAAWWQSTRAPAEPPTSPTVERSIDLPPPVAVAPQRSAPRRTTLAAPAPPPAPSLAEAAGTASVRDEPVAAAMPPASAPPASASSASTPPVSAPSASAPAAAGAARIDRPVDTPALPSAAALAAQGVALPTLRLELHAFSLEAADRFVFINGRKYREGDRLAEGPQVVAIAPTGAVLAQGGRQFMLVQE